MAYMVCFNKIIKRGQAYFISNVAKRTLYQTWPSVFYIKRGQAYFISNVAKHTLYNEHIWKPDSGVRKSPFIPKLQDMPQRVKKQFLGDSEIVQLLEHLVMPASSAVSMT